jgi:hypothetical protein
MALRPGSYDRHTPDWRGVIYENSWGIFRCTHRDHMYQKDATRCAREAYAEHKALFAADQAPPGWEPMGRRGDSE